MVLRGALTGLVFLSLLIPQQSRARSAGTKRPVVAQKVQKQTARRSSKRAQKRRRKRRDRWPPMHLEHVNTREKLTVRLYDRKGRTIRASVRKLWRFLRCHHTGKRHAIHWRLIQRIYRISRRFKGRTLRVYSGYRARRAARLRTSKHTLGRAIDFAVKGVSTRTLRDYIRKTYKTRRGLGYYPNTPFVHFDVREKSAFWVDYSGKGEEPRYAKNPYAVLKQERAPKPRKKQLVARKRPTAGERFGPPAPRPASVVEGPRPLGPAPASAAQPALVSGKTEPAKAVAPRVSNVRSVPP